MATYTYDTVKEIIRTELDELENKNYGVAAKTDYRLGKINGMLKVFVITGIITHDEMKNILDEIYI